MPKYISGRVKKTPQSKLTDDRYKYLSVGESEPNLGDPIVPGDAPPFGQQYQIVSVEGYPGERYWIPVGGGIIPGSISVFDEGSLVGGLSSTTQLNFVGTAINAIGNGGANPGIAVTVSFTPPGNNTEIIFKESDDFATSPKLTFDSSNGLVKAGDQIQIGAGGTVITATRNGLVGIGSTLPTQELDVVGDIRLHGTIYDYLNDPGLPQDVLIKNNFGGLIWVGQDTLRTGAGGTYTNIQYHNSAGLVDGAPNFVFDDINNRVGIGSTQPKYILDVLGKTQIVGDTIITGDFSVSGISTFTSYIDANGGAYIDNIRIGITNDNEIDTATGGLTIDSNSGFTVIDDNLRVSGILTAQGNVDLGASASNTVSFIAEVDTDIIPTVSLTQNLGASDARWNLYVNNIYGNENSSFTLGNLNVLGITTLGSDSNDTLDINALVRTDIIPSGNYQYDLGSPSNRWDSIYADELYANLFVGIANTTLTIKSAESTSGVTNYLTFVDSNNTGVAYENLYTSSNIKYVPLTGSLEFNNLSLLGNANVVGVATFGSDVVLGNDTINDEVTFNSRVASSIIPSLTETFDLGSPPVSDGGVDKKWNNIYAINYYGRFIGNADTASKLENSRNISITGDLSWEVDFDGSTDVTAIGTLANTGVVAGTYGDVSSYPVITVDSKGRITVASEQLVDFANATVLNSNNIKTVSSSASISYFLPFAQYNVGSGGTYQPLYTDGDITYNPNTNKLTVPNVSIGDSLTVLNNSYFGSDINDIIVFNGLIDSNFIPDDDITYNLGAPNFKWNQLHINEIYVESTINGVIQYADKIKTSTPAPENQNQSHYLTFVIDANDVTGDYEDLYTDSNISYNPSTNLLSIVDTTLSGNLVVNGNTDIGDASSDTLSINASVDTNIIPRTDNLYNLGSSGIKWNTVFATTFEGTLDGIAKFAEKVSIATTNTNTDHYITFVNGDNGTRSVFVDDGIKYNANTAKIIVTNANITDTLQVDGDTILGSDDGDSVSFPALINSSFIPSNSPNLTIGASDARWSSVYADTFNGRFVGTADDAEKVSVGTTTGSAPYYLTFVDENNSPRQNEYLYTDSAITYNPNTDLLSVPNATLSGNLVVNGNTDIGSDSSDTLTIIASIDSSIIPQTDNTYNLGSTSYKWNTVYATIFDGIFQGNADTATRVSTGTTTGTTPYYLTFVDSNNSTRDNEYLYTDSAITYNPNTDLLSVPNATLSGNLVVNGNTDIGSDSSDTLTIAAYVDSNIIPTPTGSRNLGSTGNRWGTVYATIFDGIFQGNADTATRVSTGTTTGTTPYYLTFVDSNNSTRDNEYLYTDSAITYNPNTDLLSVNDIKPSKITDRSNSAGTDNYVLTSVTVGGTRTIEWKPAGTASGSEAIGGITIERPSGTIIGTQLGITTVGFSTNFTATASGNNKVLIDLASSLYVDNIYVTNVTTPPGEPPPTFPGGIVVGDPGTPGDPGAPGDIDNVGDITNPDGDTTINGVLPIGGITIEDDGSQVGTALGTKIVNFGANLTATSDGSNRVTIDGAAAVSSVGSLNVTATPNGTFYPTLVNGTGNGKVVYMDTGISVIVSGGVASLSVQNDITAFASDIRLKTDIQIIDNAIEKVKSLSGFTYNFNELGGEQGFDTTIRHSGVSAQEVQEVLPEAVAPAPVNNDYLTVKYEKLVPLLIQAIKEQNDKIEILEKKIQSIGG